MILHLFVPTGVRGDEIPEGDGGREAGSGAPLPLLRPGHGPLARPAARQGQAASIAQGHEPLPLPAPRDQEAAALPLPAHPPRHAAGCVVMLS